MAFLTAGGSQIGSSNITDGAILNADINASAAIAQSKIAGSGNNNSDIIAVVSGSDAALSVTTVADQRMIVFINGYYTSNGVNGTISGQRGGVSKQTISAGGDSTEPYPFSLMWLETPGAVTEDISVSPSAQNTITSYNIVVVKLKS